MPLSAADERTHETSYEEWTFSCWADDGSLGVVTGYRLVGGRDAWYWWGFARQGAPLLHVTEFEIPRRSDPLLAKAEALWAEMTCESPFEQWTIGNETYAVALADPQEALRRGYGEATPIAMDLEWYATGPPTEQHMALDSGAARDDEEAPRRESGAVAPSQGCYEQRGVAHGRIELAGSIVELVELPAHRTHRWSAEPLSPTTAPLALAHVGLRAPFLLPDGSAIDLVLTSDGWRRRPTPTPAASA